MTQPQGIVKGDVLQKIGSAIMLTGEISPSHFWTSMAIGTLMTLLMFGSVLSFRTKAR